MSGPPTTEHMADVDALAWSIESDPRLRSPMAAVAVFDGRVERNAVRHAFERASRIVPRMRHRVVPDPVGVSTPRWVVDPDFRLSFHVRATDLGEAGERALLDLAQAIVAQPFDRSRPLWEVTHVDRYGTDRSALVMKTHHALSDGMGAVRMMLEVFDLQPELTPGREEMPPPPTAPESDPSVLDSLDHETQLMLGSIRRSLDVVAGAATDPVGAVQTVSDLVSSAGRVLRPSTEPLSPIMRSRSGNLELGRLVVPLGDLKSAGARVGGSVNDAFVAAVLLGLGAYHRAHDVDLDRIRLAIPINTRAGDDDAVGNRWSPSREEFPLDVDDPDELMIRVRATVVRLRSEPALGMVEQLAGVARRLPDSVVSSVFAGLAHSVDAAASNVPGSPIPLFLGGHEVVELIPFGPLAGAGCNVTLLSLGDVAHIGVAVDPASVPDRDELTRHLFAGFDRVVSGS